MSIQSNTPRCSQRDRTIEYVWDVQAISPTVTEQAVLSVHHNADRKCFFARLGQEKLEDQGGYSVRSYAVFSGLTVATEPVARFSAKKLEEFAIRILATVQASTDEKVLQYFQPSDRSCGCQGSYHEAGCEVYSREVTRG